MTAINASHDTLINSNIFAFLYKCDTRTCACNYAIPSNVQLMLDVLPGTGYYHIKRSGGGGFDLASILETKFGARSPNKKQNLGGCGTTRGKNWDRNLGKRFTTLILGSYLKFKGQNLGNMSWRQNLGFWHEFQRQSLGPSPPDLLIMKSPPGDAL